MMNPRDLDAMRLLAHSLANAGKFAAARDILSGLASAAPDDVYARRGLVYAHLRLGEYQEAEPLARRLAEEASGSDKAPALFFHAHSLWGCGRLDECRAAVDRYAEQLGTADSRRGKA